MTNPRSDILETLRQRIFRGLQTGGFTTGDRLPSARALAAEFEADHRQVLLAYRQLAAESLVEVRPRGGIYVAASAPIADGPPAISADWMADLLTQGLTREIPIVALHEWMRRAVETLRLRAVVVAATDDQAAGLVRELAEDFGFEASGIRLSDLSDSAAPPLEMRRADLVVPTIACEARARSIGDGLRKPVISVSVRPDLISAEWRQLLRKPVYVVVADPSFIGVLREFLADLPNVENLRPLVAGQDELRDIPEGAAVYITQKARSLIDPSRIAGRILPPARTISRESARAIIDFIVSANLQALENRRAT